MEDLEVNWREMTYSKFLVEMQSVRKYNEKSTKESIKWKSQKGNKIPSEDLQKRKQ